MSIIFDWLSEVARAGSAAWLLSLQIAAIGSLGLFYYLKRRAAARSLPVPECGSGEGREAEEHLTVSDADCPLELSRRIDALEEKLITMGLLPQREKEKREWQA